MTVTSKDVAPAASRVSRHIEIPGCEMTIEIAGAPETPASDPKDALQLGGVQTQDQASDTTVLITEVQVALGTAAATGVRRKDRRWVALLSRIFVPARRHHARSGVLTNPAWRIWTTRE
jgi:hypothetical protein